MALAAAAWVAGVAWQLQRESLSDTRSMAAMALAASLVAALALVRRPAGVFALGLMSLCIAGFASTDWRASQRLADRLPPALEGVDLVVVGVIAEMPHDSPIGTRFVLDVATASRDGLPVRVPRRVSLGWYRGWDDTAPVAGPAPVLTAGDRWRLPVRLKRPHGTMNPHGFDLELWLFEQGIGASGTVRPGAEPLARAVAHPLERTRQAVRDAILLRVPDASAAGVLAALAVGDQAAIDRDGWDIFRVTGVAHLMSISGLHVTMFAWLAGAAIGWAWRRWPRGMRVVPAPVAARLGGLGCAAGYALLAGWGVPAQRTVLMIGVVVVLRTRGVRWPQPLVLLAAALAVTVLDPWALLQAGFWLSFTAVALLIASEPAAGVGAPRTGWRATLRAALHTQAVATVGLAPLSMVFFQQVSIVGLVANLLAIPLVTLVITPLALLGAVLPPLWGLAGGVVQGLQAALGLLAGWPGAVWTSAAAPLWAVGCGLVGGTLLVLPLPWRLRLLGLPLLVPLAAPPVARPAEGQFEAVIADIGQGTAVLVRTRAHLLVYDAGPQYSPDADAGSRVLLPLLRVRGERKVDLLLLSHRDADHVGGAASLLGGLPVLASTSSLAPGHPLLARLPAHRRCDAGQQWTWDGVRFEILHPQAADHAMMLKSNALSCVLKVTDAAGQSLLLTGDIEAAQESALVAQLGAAGLASETLLVPHHGSRTSSTEAFLQAVSPRTGVVQAAYRSRFGHPAPDVMARYARLGIDVRRSDRCGAYTVPPDGTAGVCQRATDRRYWHHGAVASAPDAD